MRSLAHGAALLMVCLLSGCLILPIPTPEHNPTASDRGKQRKLQTRSNVETNQLDKIQPGVTTREALLLSIGEPDFNWTNERLFAYRWARVRGYVVFALGVGPPFGGGMETHALSKSYCLVIRFDRQGLVESCELKQGVWPGENDLDGDDTEQPRTAAGMPPEPAGKMPAPQFNPGEAYGTLSHTF